MAAISQLNLIIWGASYRFFASCMRFFLKSLLFFR